MLRTSDGGSPIFDRGESALGYAGALSNSPQVSPTARAREGFLSLGRFVGFHALAFATSGLLLVIAKLGKGDEVEIFD